LWKQFCGICGIVEFVEYFPPKIPQNILHKFHKTQIPQKATRWEAKRQRSFRNLDITTTTNSDDDDDDNSDTDSPHHQKTSPQKKDDPTSKKGDATCTSNNTPLVLQTDGESAASDESCPSLDDADVVVDYQPSNKKDDRRSTRFKYCLRPFVLP
jgi:hypothetical protein